MKKERFFLLIIFIMFLFLSVSYATVNTTNLSITGISTAADNGTVRITNVSLYSSNKLKTNSSSVTFTDNSINFNIQFQVSNSDLQNNVEFYATYKVTLYNDSISNYNFAMDLFHPSVATETNPNMVVSPELQGISSGESIPAKSSKEFYVRLNVFPTEQGTYTVSGDSEVNPIIDNSGNVIGSLTGNTTGSLRSPNTIVEFTASVINTYTVPKTFTFSINNNNFMITDSNGNNLGSFIINAEETETFNFYIMKSNNAVFAVDTQKINVNINPVDDTSSSMGIVTILVDQDTSISDDIPPEVTFKSATLQPTVGSVLVEWEGSDNVGIDYYRVEVYNSSNTRVKYVDTIADEEEMLITDLGDGDYYFKVIAYDQKGNSSNAQSSIQTYTWHFTVTWVLSNNATSTGTNNDLVAYGDSYEKTLGASGDQLTPSTVTIEMEGNSNPDYSYSASTGELKIQNVTGNLTITAAGRNNGCLVKGTKIMLANGKYKYVEDIEYNDLLAVWNYDTGSITYEYPLLIKNAKKGASYYKVSLSDGSFINIFDDHGFYNTDLNLVVALKDKENFHIGSNIAKINDDGTFTSVTITNIEEVNEEIEYYFVASARYFNVIANNLLTTYQETKISNLYGFTDNAKWPIFKELLLKIKNNVYDYEKFSDVLPYYMYKGFRAGEAGFLINLNVMTLDEFKKFVSVELMAEGIVKDLIVKNKQRYWMVTTSLDKITDKNKNKYLFKEGSTYTLPKSKKIKAFYSTSENKYYKPGEKITIDYSMHFIAINK